MNALNLSNNLVRLRRERKITQEELADFIGVTKASVSKWENRQSTPDILLLPQLASFFGVTVDELIGYEAQLSREQIKRCYAELTKDFAKLPFQDAMEKTRALVRRYYSCYPFLLQICVLYLNHFMLAKKEEEQKQILQEGDTLCERILQYCADVGVCNDAIAMKAVFRLQLGKTFEVIEMLEPITDPSRLSEQNDMLLIQAYQAAGENEKAKSFTQIRLYSHLISLISTAIQSLALYGKEPERCEEIIRRTEGILEIYKIDTLHPNLAAQFYYQAAVVYASEKENGKALEKLEGFETCVCSLLSSERMILHGDEFFDRLEEWIDQLPLGEQAPRDMVFARQNALAALSHPVFSELNGTEKFRNIYCHISEGGNEYA